MPKNHRCFLNFLYVFVLLNDFLAFYEQYYYMFLYLNSTTHHSQRFQLDGWRCHASAQVVLNLVQPYIPEKSWKIGCASMWSPGEMSRCAAKKPCNFQLEFLLRYTRDTYDVLMHNCQSLRKSQHQGKHFSPRHAHLLDSHQGNHFSDEVAAFLIEVKAMVGIGCLWHKSDFQTLMTWP